MRPKVNDSEEAKDDEILGLNRRRSGKFAPIPGIWRQTKLKKFISEVGKLFRVTHRSGRWTKEEDTLDSSEEKHIEQILEVADETGNLKEEEDDDRENGDESLNNREEKEIKRILRVARRTGKLGETFRVAQRTGTLEDMLRVAHRTGHLEETLRERLTKWGLERNTSGGSSLGEREKKSKGDTQVGHLGWNTSSGSQNGVLGRRRRRCMEPRNY